MSELHNEQGTISSEPDPIKETSHVIESGETSIEDAGGGLKATGNITPETVQPALEQEAKRPAELESVDQTKKAETPKTLFDILKSEQQPPETPPAQEPLKEVSYNAQWESEKQGYLAKISELESQLVFQKELEKNPLEAVAKYVPGIVFNKESPYFFDKTEYVIKKMADKYGSDFVYEPGDAYKIGTASYNYRNDITKWEREAEQAEYQAQNTIKAEEQKEIELFNQSKSTVMAKYGMDEVAFDSKIMSKLKQMSDSDRLVLLADALMIVENNNQNKINVVNKSNSLRTAPPSPTDLSGRNTITVENREEEEFQRMFGKPYGGGLSSY